VAAIIFDAGLEEIRAAVGLAGRKGIGRDARGLVRAEPQSGDRVIVGIARGTVLLMQIDHWARQILSI
jgi:hypothetical protein